MKPIVYILNRTIALEFYRQHATLFLLAIGICFGFLSGREHVALAAFFVSSPVLVAIPITVWTLYFLKSINFFRQSLQKKENQFLFDFTLLDPSVKLLALFLTWINLLAPILAYALFLLIMAWQNHHVIVLLLINLHLMILFTIGIFGSKRLLLRISEQERGRIKKWYDKKFHKHYSLFSFEWILRKDVLTVLFTKLFCVLLLMGVATLYRTDAFDYRLFGMAIVASFSANAIFIQWLHRFENFHLSFIRSLPLSLHRRLTYFILTVLIFCLPELGFSFRQFPSGVAWWYQFLLPGLGIALLLLYYGLLYLKEVETEKFMQLVFYISMTEIVLILFKVPVAALMIVNTVCGLFFFYRFYYRFEYLHQEP